MDLVRWQEKIISQIPSLCIELTQRTLDARDSNGKYPHETFLERSQDNIISALKDVIEPHMAYVSETLIGLYNTEMVVIAHQIDDRKEAIDQGMYMVLSGGSALDYYLSPPYGTSDYDLKFVVPFVSEKLLDHEFYPYMVRCAKYVRYAFNVIMCVFLNVFANCVKGIDKILTPIRTIKDEKEKVTNIVDKLIVDNTEIYENEADVDVDENQPVSVYFLITQNERSGIFDHYLSINSLQLDGLHTVSYATVGENPLVVGIIDTIVMEPKEPYIFSHPYNCFTTLPRKSRVGPGVRDMPHVGCYGRSSNRSVKDTNIQARSGPNQPIPYIVDPKNGLKYASLGFVIYDLYRMLFIVSEYNEKTKSKEQRYVGKIMNLIDTLHKFSGQIAQLSKSSQPTSIFSFGHVGQAPTTGAPPPIQLPVADQEADQIGGQRLRLLRLLYLRPSKPINRLQQLNYQEAYYRLVSDYLQVKSTRKLTESEFMVA